MNQLDIRGCDHQGTAQMTLTLGTFFVRIWLRKDCLCLKPLAVGLKRFRAPELLLSFGIFPFHSALEHVALTSFGAKTMII